MSEFFRGGISTETSWEMHKRFQTGFISIEDCLEIVSLWGLFSINFVILLTFLRILAGLLKDIVYQVLGTLQKWRNSGPQRASFGPKRESFKISWTSTLS